MKIHFVGIGGIGLSGLARYMKKKGCEISGSDIIETKLIKQLKEEGIKLIFPTVLLILKIPTLSCIPQLRNRTIPNLWKQKTWV